MRAACRYFVFPGYHGKYDYYRYDTVQKSSDLYDCAHVRSYDRLLHRTLIQIFRERRLTSGQIRRLIRAPKKHGNGESIFDLILKRQPSLGKLLLKRRKISLFWIAILSCYQKSVELLVRSGADVKELYGWSNNDQRLGRKSTVLHALLTMYPSSWNERFINLLIEHGADLEAQDFDSFTPLHLAVVYGRVKITKTLLDKGVDVNAVNSTLKSPLLYAAYSREVKELVPLLMRHGADVLARDEHGWNLLYYLTECSYRDNSDLIQVYLEIFGLSPREMIGSDQYQLIHSTVYLGKIDLVNLYLDYGANVNARVGGFQKEFPLYIAARYCKDPAMLLTLLKRRANIDMKNYMNETALHGLMWSETIDKNTVEKMHLLLSVGMDMFAEDYTGLTPFDMARLRRHNMKNTCLTGRMLKTLALRKACLQPPIELKEERIIKEKHPELWTAYEGCFEEIGRMKSTKFFKTGIFFNLLTKCQCQTEVITTRRNLEFKSKFRRYNFRAFPTYADLIKEAFQRMENHYHLLLELEDAIEEIFHNRLTDALIRKVAGYVLGCEACKLKVIVDSSRGPL